MPLYATSYTDAKYWSIVVTAVLVMIVGGAFSPWFSRARLWWLSRHKPNDSDPQEKKAKYDATVAWHQRVVQSPGLSALLGADGRLSTSKTIAALWTAVVAYIVV